MPNTWTFGPASAYSASWDGGGPIALSAPSGGGAMSSWEPPDLGALAVAGLAAAALPPFTAADCGYLAWNFDPAAAAGTNILTAGTLYLARLNFRTPVTVSNIVVNVTTAGSGASTQSFAGLYSSAGTLLSGSADIGTAVSSTGSRALPLTTPQAMAGGTFAWAAILVNLGTTQPTLAKASTTNAAFNGALAASGFRTCVNGTSLTSLPAPVTPASNTLTNSIPIWAGCS